MGCEEFEGLVAQGRLGVCGDGVLVDSEPHGPLLTRVRHDAEDFHSSSCATMRHVLLKHGITHL